LGCPWKCNIIQLTPQLSKRCLRWHHIPSAPERYLPTQLLDQGRGIPSDIARKFDGINSFQNYVVSLHGVGPGKWRSSCRQAWLLTSLIVQYTTTVTRIRYRGADKSLARPTSRCILFDGWNISFDASLVIYTNRTNIPPIMIKNRIYGNQNLLSL
jgi:hypothetical protein